MSTILNSGENENYKVDQETAISEIQDFLSKHNQRDARNGKFTKDFICDEYATTLDEVRTGRLKFEDGLPVYTLNTPLFEGQETEILTVKWRSRISEGTKMRLMDGLNVAKNQGTFFLRLMAYSTQLSITEIEKLSKDDYDLINQVTSVF